MTNTERLLIVTLPRWSGVTFSTIAERVTDMWLRGEKSGHHGGLPYDPEGIELLRRNIRRDFEKAPYAREFQEGGAIQTVGDLDDAMQGIAQKPYKAAAYLRSLGVPARPRRRAGGRP